jgi:hypothetical protein
MFLLCQQVNDKEFSITLTMYFSVQWKEPRLVTNLTVNESIPVDLQFLDHLWVPNIFIYDLRTFSGTKLYLPLFNIFMNKNICYVLTI